MKGFLLGVLAVVIVIVAIVFSVIQFAASRSADVYNSALDPTEMKNNYEAMHANCSDVRTLWTQWQTDSKAASDFKTVNAGILDGSVKVSALQAAQVQQQAGVLDTVAQGDRDDLATAASAYDTLVETKTKNIGAQWVKIIFFDTGLPQSIQPPYTDVNCGSGVWTGA